MRRLLAVVVFVSVAGLCARAAHGAVVFGQVDDFQDGTAMGWEEGGPSPNQPTNVAAGGPLGDGDRFLRNVSSGVGAAGSRMVMFNFPRWSGDFNAAGVTRLDAWVANPGARGMDLRVALRSPTGTVFATAAAIDLPAGAPWRRVTFDLTEGALAHVEGGQALPEVLAGVEVMRILSSASPDWEGDPMAATLAVDNIRALHLPGDANFDGRVNPADFLTVRRNLGSSTPGGADGWRAGDFDFNGRVDGRDVVLLRRHFGDSVPVVESFPNVAPALAALPEPGGVAALCLALAPAALRRRRR